MEGNLLEPVSMNSTLDMKIIQYSDIVSDYQRQIISVVIYVFVCGLISIFGTITNIINMIIFYRQGLDTTINISFFSMAVSDLCCLLIQQVFNLYVNPLCEKLDLPMVYLDVQYLTNGVPREVFARITCLITVYVTAERCICITFPLHVKRMITPKRTKTIICLIYFLTFLSAAPLYTTAYIDWQYYPLKNRTLLGIVATGKNEVTEAACYFIHGISGVLSFLSVVILTSILIRKLVQKSVWRETANVQQYKSESMSHRDRTTVSMIVLIASILIICYIPSVLLGAGTFLEPEFSVGGIYYNFYYISWSFAVLFETINSSVNIFLYLKMSTKYRRCFQEIISCRKTDKNSTRTDQQSKSSAGRI